MNSNYNVLEDEEDDEQLPNSNLYTYHCDVCGASFYEYAVGNGVLSAVVCERCGSRAHLEEE